jgi:membrane associated rhomboid family serine protease
MNAPQLKETDYLKAWSLFFVCATIGGGLVGAIAGGILGAILAVAGMPTASIKFAGSVAGLIASMPVSYFLFRFFVSRFLVEKLASQQLSNEPSIVTSPETGPHRLDLQ